MGAEYVERSLAASDDFNMPLQEYITKYAWGDVWRRPGLDRRSRSILNIGMLTALNRPAELKLHLRGALSNGVTREEIRECLLQSAVYCGAPAALERYQRWRRFDSLSLIGATDGLNRLFSNRSGPLRLARDLGLGLVNQAPPLKRFFMQHAMGLAGDLPRLTRGAAL